MVAPIGAKDVYNNEGVALGWFIWPLRGKLARKSVTLNLTMPKFRVIRSQTFFLFTI